MKRIIFVSFVQVYDWKTKTLKNILSFFVCYKDFRQNVHLYMSFFTSSSSSIFIFGHMLLVLTSPALATITSMYMAVLGVSSREIIITSSFMFYNGKPLCDDYLSRFIQTPFNVRCEDLLKVFQQQFIMSVFKQLILLLIRPCQRLIFQPNSML